MKPIAILLFLTFSLLSASPELERATKLYHQTEYEQSLKILQAIPNKDAAVYLLMGRNYYMQGEYKKATDTLEKALAAEPGNAECVLWLGRAFGRRAESASVLTAPGYASKTRQYFEKSVQLNPNSIEALNDLFEYYLEAPGIMGGGLDKAQATAERIEKLSASEGHGARARIAENRKQFPAAEEHWRKAVETAPKEVGRLIDLARFLTRRNRLQEADEVLARADRLAPDSPNLTFSKAEMYIQSHRNLDQARDLLKRYVNMQLTPDDPPRSDANKLLRKAQEHG